MKVWFETEKDGVFLGEADVEPEDLYIAWRLWKRAKITTFRLIFKIGHRYVRSESIEFMNADKTFEGVIVERFSTAPPPAEMSVIHK